MGVVCSLPEILNCACAGVHLYIIEARLYSRDVNIVVLPKELSEFGCRLLSKYIQKDALHVCLRLARVTGSCKPVWIPATTARLIQSIFPRDECSAESTESKT
jgi:hypothetical protein